MPLPSDLPVVDHHCHLSASGEGVEAARRFRSAGGTHLFLATQAYGGRPPTSLEGYAAQFEETERLARRVREESGVVAYVVVAPYPVDLVATAQELGLPEAVRVHRAAIELAGRWVEEQRAVALGEVGRAHFPVPPDVAEALDGLLRHALEVARDAGCPAVVHSEDLDGGGYRALADLAARSSFPVTKLVKHFAREVGPELDRAGVVPSFVARKPAARASLAQRGPWFWETDFLDDPRRPGAVLDLETVPRRARWVADSAPELTELLRVPFEASVKEVYGFVPLAGPEGPR